MVDELNEVEQWMFNLLCALANSPVNFPKFAETTAELRKWLVKYCRGSETRPDLVVITFSTNV